MFTRRELIEVMYPELLPFKDKFNRFVNFFNEFDDSEFISLYYNKTGHLLKRLRRNLYY